MAEYRFLPIALAELIHALDWYKERSPTAARRFAEQVEHALDAIEATPERFAKWDDIHRYVRLSRFPYYIAYRMTGENPLIVAIRHTSRDDPSLTDR
jgi:plasmid stabilization system protein ParE